MPRRAAAASMVVELTLAGLMAVAPAIAWFGTTSNTTIPAGESFLLGGGQPGGFTLDGRNTGEVNVEVSVAAANGRHTVLVVLEPQQTVRHRFAPQEGAVVRNLSSSGPARIRVRFNAAAESLSMRYRTTQ